MERGKRGKVKKKAREEEEIIIKRKGKGEIEGIRG